MQGKNNYIPLLLMVVLAFIIRISYCMYIRGNVPVQDASGYDILGMRLAEKGELSYEDGKPTAHREPVYPLFLAVIYYLFGHSYFAVRFAQSLIGAFTCLTVYLLARSLVNERAGIISGAISAVYPFFVYYTGYLLTETLYTFLLLVTVYLFVLNISRPKRYNLVLAGIFMGITSLCKGWAIALFPFFLAGLLVNWKEDRIRRSGIITGCFVAMLLPWAMRNYRVFHYPIVTSTNAGVTLFYGTIFWEGQLDGTNLLPEHNDNPLVKKALELKDEVARNGYYYGEAIRFIKNNPAYFLKIGIDKFFQLWRLYPHARYAYGDVIYDQPAKVLIILSILSYGLLLPFSIAGMIFSLSRKREMSFLYSVILVISLVFMVFYSQMRYRLPAMPYMIIFAACALSGRKDK